MVVLMAGESRRVGRSDVDIAPDAEAKFSGHHPASLRQPGNQPLSLIQNDRCAFQVATKQAFGIHCLMTPANRAPLSRPILDWYPNAFRDDVAKRGRHLFGLKKKIDVL